MFDMFKIFGKLGDLKDKMSEVKDTLKQIEIKYTDDLLEIDVIATADKTIRTIQINDRLFLEDKKSELQQKIVQAINNTIAICNNKAQQITKEKLKDVIPDIPGFDINNLTF